MQSPSDCCTHGVGKRNLHYIFFPLTKWIAIYPAERIGTSELRTRLLDGSVSSTLQAVLFPIKAPGHLDPKRSQDRNAQAEKTEGLAFPF
jgi:hypothetical protein